MGNEKWILYNNVEQNRSWCKQNKPPPTTPKSGLHSKKVWCCIYGGIGREFSINKELLPENQMINSNKYCPQLDKLQAALDKKLLELVNRKCIIFHQDNARSHVFWWPGKNCYSLAGKFWFISPIHQILHLQVSIYFGLYKILLKEKISTSPEDCKRHLEQFFAQKEKKFWENGITKVPEKWQKVVEQNGEYIVQ